MNVKFVILLHTYSRMFCKLYQSSIKYIYLYLTTANPCFLHVTLVSSEMFANNINKKSYQMTTIQPDLSMINSHL